MPNWERFLSWLVGTEEGEEFMQRHPDVVGRWLQAFNEYALSLYPRAPE
jgi:hypothetical protein